MEKTRLVNCNGGIYRLTKERYEFVIWCIANRVRFDLTQLGEQLGIVSADVGKMSELQAQRIVEHEGINYGGTLVQANAGREISSEAS